MPPSVKLEAQQSTAGSTKTDFKSSSTANRTGLLLCAIWQITFELFYLKEAAVLLKRSQTTACVFYIYGWMCSTSSNICAFANLILKNSPPGPDQSG